MDTNSFLRHAVQELSKAGIATARLDCLVLLEDATGKDRSWLLAHPDHHLQIATVQKMNKQVAQRALHEPLAYIRHDTEFYGRKFYVDHRVLEPRPESETMIDLLKQLSLPKQSNIADIGTGSGALGITAALEIKESRVIVSDIDTDCLKVATQNAVTHKADITFLCGNLLAPLSKHHPEPTVLLCNLPYVPESFHINAAAMHEPRIAIFGGLDGLDIYRMLFGQLKSFGAYPKFILTEAMPPQHDNLSTIAKTAGYSLQTIQDFILLFAAN